MPFLGNARLGNNFLLAVIFLSGLWCNVALAQHGLPYQVVASWYHSCALDDSGVACWGYNEYGQTTPPSLTNPTAVSAGAYHTCALDDSGVACWGLDSDGQASVPQLTNPTAVTAGSIHTCALDDTGVICWGWNGDGRTNVPSLSNPTAISAGGLNSCALDDTGVVCWGDNSYGQNDVPTLTNPTALSAGTSHTCALDDSGVVCWGDNADGQTDVPILSNPTTVSAGGSHTCALDDTGVVCWGDNTYSQITIPALAYPVSSSAGGVHSCALDVTGVVCWGGNFNGQMDLPETLSFQQLTSPSLDMDSNGVLDLAVLGSTTDGKSAVLSFDPDTGSRTGGLVYPGWFTPDYFDMIPDGNASGNDDFAVLGTTSDGKSAWMVHDPATSSQLQAYVFPAWFIPSQMDWLDDSNGNNAPELVVLGSTSDGKSVWQINDSKTRDQLAIRVLPSWFTGEQLVIADDINGNGHEELVILGTTSDGKKAWLLYDSSSASQLQARVFPAWFTPETLTVIDDLSGNDKEEIVVIGATSDGKRAGFIHDSETAAQVSVWLFPGWFTPQQLMEVDAANGSSAARLAVLGIKSDGRYATLVLDSDAPGTVQVALNLPDWLTPLELDSPGVDLDGNHAEDLLVSGVKSNGGYALLLYDNETGSQNRAMNLPGWFSITP